jgi:hypothetical protein
MTTEIEQLQSGIREDVDRLKECLRRLSKTTSQYITEIDYAAEDVRDEAEARIKALEEVINPKIATLNSEHKKRIAALTKSFNQELENLKKLKSKTENYIESDEGKIRLYQREAQTQASKEHVIYEKRWKAKSAETKKELNGLKKELKRTEKSIKNLVKQRASEITKLQVELEDEINRARQPIVDLEAARDAKLVVFKREAQRLLALEKPVVDSINSAIKLGEVMSAKFAALGVIDRQLKGPALYYVPFYVACFQSGSSERFIFLPPSMTSAISFSAMFKGAFGRSKIKDLFVARFKSAGTLIEKVQELAEQDHFVGDQIRSLGEKNNLLGTRLTRGSITEGLSYLRAEGWLSDKEFQIVRNSLP